MAVLIMLGLPDAGTRFQVKPSGNTVIGRDLTCDIRITRQAISRHHAQLICNNGNVFIEDSESTNGTFLNENRLNKRTKLQDGDRIRLHDIPFVYFVSDNANVSDVETMRLNSFAQTAKEIPLMAGGHGVTELLTKLESFLEMARDLGSSFDTEVLLQRMLDLLFQMYPQAHNGEIHVEMENAELIPIAMKHGRDSDSKDLSGSPYNEQIVKDVYESGVGVIHNEMSGESVSVLSETHSIICMPIFCHSNNAFGCILLETDDSSHPFTETDRELVSAVAILAGQGIGYARAHEIQLKHAKIERQLENACTIQLSILPKESPILPGYKFAAHYAAAGSVGGDYYFYHQMPSGQMFVGIADASGKGLSAAMNIVNFAGEVRLQLATSNSLKKAMQGINKHTCQGDLSSFITACICLIDPSNHQVVVMNAGHMPPLLVRKGQPIKEFKNSNRGFPFGVDPDEEYHLATFQLEPGDQVVLYTDGVSEAMNFKKELYHLDRLKNLLSNCDSGVEKTVSQIVNDVGKYRGKNPANDDTTIVAFEYVE